MSLPPLTNLFASAAADPGAAADVEAGLKRTGKFDWVRQATGGWVIAGKDLPGGPSTHSQPKERKDVVFAEGFDRLTETEIDEAARLMARCPERLSDVAGDFTLAHFGSDGRATVARSCGGQVPVYTWSDASGSGFSTLLSDAAHFRGDQPELDPLALATWLAWFTGFPHERTFLSGVRALKRGHCAVLRPRGGHRSVRYWFPVPSSLPPRIGRVAEDVARRFRQQVLGALKRQTDVGTGNLLTLSGGVDSSAIAALMRGVLGRPLATLSLVPPAERTRPRELYFVDRIVEDFQAYPSFRFPLNGEERRGLLRMAPAVVHQPLHPALGALAAIKKNFPVTVLIGGEFADEICGAQWHFPDWARDASASRLLRWRENPDGLRDMGRWLKRRILEHRGRYQVPYLDDLPPLVQPALREQYRAWITGMRCRLADDPSPYRTLASYMDRESAMGMNWEVTSALGVRRVWPFVSRETIELSYSIHPDDVIGPGTKRLLRRALHEDVPAWSLYRSDKGGWAAEIASGNMLWNEALPDELAGIVRNDWFPHPPATIPAESGLRLLQLITTVSALREIRAKRARSPE